MQRLSVISGVAQSVRPWSNPHLQVARKKAVVGQNANTNQNDLEGGGAVRAAEYVRMSTENQKYSTENQSDAIRRYATSRGFEIVRTYADSGKSGLRMDGRDALKNLIGDVQTGNADFKTILVYDVSRWGRFQDADESAYYEYICKRSGISVQYCAEQFENDGSPVSTIVKGVKRAMAGEYSRELSTKVFAGQCRLIELGFRQGGQPGFGLRRSLIDQVGNFKNELGHGEYKSIQTDRIVLSPGSEVEVKLVQEIYERFVRDKLSEREIAQELNSRGITRGLNQPWTRGTVHQILINEKYIGNNVWNHVSFKLKKWLVKNQPSMWIRADGVFTALVNHDLFYAAQSIIKNRSLKLTDAEMLDALRTLHQSQGALSGLIVDESETLPSSSTYRTRFGSLLRAYQLIGFTPPRDYSYIKVNRAVRELYPRVISDIEDGFRLATCAVHRDHATDLLKINEETSISLTIARCCKTRAGSYRWNLRFDTGLHPDITIAVRMDASNRSVLDFYVLPRIDLASRRLRLAETNGLAIDCYHFDSLDTFYEFFRPVSIEEAA
jgi:DNA invertase Pin-like site-specific DNA recombinase